VLGTVAGDYEAKMKIVDTSGSLMWRMKQRTETARVTGTNTVDNTLRNKLRELHRQQTTIRMPADSNFYAEGRSTLKFYQQGFVDIRSFNNAYTSAVQNARMTDEQIEALIARMNLTPR
jgi:hypothetical protein